MSTRVLLIDDDARLFALLTEYLAPHDVFLEHAADGGRGLAALAAGAFDVVLLDVMMPGLGGLEVLQRIRMGSGSRPGSVVPVIMLTARGDEADRVVGLELGADDYVAKPFSPRELLARLRAVLRRLRPGLVGERLSAEGVVIEVDQRRATVDGRALTLTALELDLLAALMRRPGRVVPRSALLQEAGRDEVVGERTVDQHISKLRKKLGDEGPRLIQTVRGVGYVFSGRAS
ncbi:MAG: response regulator transcription factor [Myxococcota bacterium]